MRRAYDQRVPAIDDQMEDRLGYAAEIRAVADWLVPEEADPPVESETTKFPWPPAYQAMSDAQWEMRQSLRAKLLTEVDRAEKGAE